MAFKLGIYGSSFSLSLRRKWINDENEIRVAIQSKTIYFEKTKHFTFIFKLIINRRSINYYMKNSAKIVPNFTGKGFFIFLLNFLESFLHEFNQLITKDLGLISYSLLNNNFRKNKLKIIQRKNDCCSSLE